MVKRFPIVRMRLIGYTNNQKIVKKKFNIAGRTSKAYKPISKGINRKTSRKLTKYCNNYDKN